MVAIPINILVVDDEKDFVEIISLRLAERGHAVKGAYDGRQCLEMLGQRDFDVVLLDIKMPGMDGIAALREIKKKFPLVEVILLTGHGSIDTAVEGMKRGAFDYLRKPYDFNALLEKLGQAGKKKAAQEERIRKAEALSLVRRTGGF